MTSKASQLAFNKSDFVAISEDLKARGKNISPQQVEAAWRQMVRHARNMTPEQVEEMKKRVVDDVMNRLKEKGILK